MSHWKRVSHPPQKEDRFELIRRSYKDDEAKARFRGHAEVIYVDAMLLAEKFERRKQPVHSILISLARTDQAASNPCLVGWR
jgi:hypothetical protein